MKITLRQLEIFSSLYETHRVSLTAARCHLSASAVSQSLRELEGALGAPLFVRGSNGLRPTPAALTLLPYASLLVKKAAEVESLFSDAQKGRAGTLSVGANRRMGIYVLSRRLMDMKRRLPSVEIRLAVDDNRVIEEAVLNQKLDVGFVSGRPASAELEGFPCFEDRMAVVVGLGSALMSPYAAPQEIAEANWVIEKEQQEDRSVERYLAARGIRMQSVTVMETMGAVKRAVGTGYGAAVLPYLSVREEIGRGDLVEILKPDTAHRPDSQQVWAFWRRGADPALRSVFFELCGIEPLS